MKALLSNPVYVKLFAAQVVALSGTGLLTVALGLLAYDLAGARAGAVLGLVYTIKMVAYVGLSPLAQAWAVRLPRRAVLVGADVVRVAVALCLPFVDALWQVYVLIFVLQSASATFTPAYQAVLPDILPDEGDYTRALSLSRLAYDLENLTSPMLAAALLGVAAYPALFWGTALGFAASAALVLATVLPEPGGADAAPFRERVSRGIRIYLATPRLRGLLALTLGAAAAGAFVLVNTVVLVRAGFGRGDAALALAMAAYGAGSMTAALALPRVLERCGDRPVMIVAGVCQTALTVALAIWLAVAGLPAWPVFLLLWAGLGACYAGVLTPSGRLLRRSSGPADRPALFAAQFALSHACWLITYPLAGWAGDRLGMGAALALLSALAALGLCAAWRLWPADMDKSRDL
ncbi:MFS transporter [Thalassococcus profundi]|uniref:MFS transporter n=1 Tax=Thalassococcus profundi TaxID=2282382 RepID=A0A369TRN1_9RHOB|nr:MFS transporter [Thalassococcus profundi]RDD65616.1 MFS transporter [Thalassococcus profundi]